MLNISNVKTIECINILWILNWLKRYESEIRVVVQVSTPVDSITRYPLWLLLLNSNVFFLLLSFQVPTQGASQLLVIQLSNEFNDPVKLAVANVYGLLTPDILHYEVILFFSVTLFSIWRNVYSCGKWRINFHFIKWTCQLIFHSQALWTSFAVRSGHVHIIEETQNDTV